MNILSNYNIPFSGLKNGTHRFDFLVEHSFFKSFENTTVNEGRVWINLVLSKHETMMVLEFHIQGSVHVPCDRCLEPFDLPIEGDQKLIVKFGEKSYEETDEIFVISRAEHNLNIAQFIYEFILLLIPFKVVHSDQEDGEYGCRQDALEAIQQVFSHQTAAGMDPRWDALKKLKKQGKPK